MKKVKKRLFIFIGTVLFIVLTMLFMCYIFLPAILERYIIPEFAPGFGILNSKVHVERADIYGGAISSLRIGDESRPGVELLRASALLDGTELSSLDIDGLKLNIESKNRKFTVSGIREGVGGAGKTSQKINFSLPLFLSRHFSSSVSESEININMDENGSRGRVHLPFKLKLQRSDNSVKFDLKVRNASITYNKTSVSLPLFELTGTVFPHADSLDIVATAKFAKVEVSSPGYLVEGIKGQVPFALNVTENGITLMLPEKQKPLKGIICIKRCSVDDLSFKDIKLQTLQSLAQFAINGACNAIIEGYPVRYSLRITTPSPDRAFAADLSIDFDEKNLDIPLNSLPKVSSKAQIRGDLKFHADVKYQNSHLTAASLLEIHNGSFEEKSKKLLVDGIDLSFGLEDMLRLKSKPKQKLSFKSCRYNDFIITNGEFDFQTESPRSILVEKSKFNWCSGTAAVNAFRITPDRPEDIDLILYCDRLKVAELLNQFNIGKASGEGRVSGKIPIVYKSGKLHVDNGFLYSTPGVGGNMALTDFLGPLSQMASVMQIEIAEAALRDFNYNWLRIKLNSEKKELVLTLDMDGAPAGLLPFGFDPGKGGLYKSEDSGTEAKFLGISFQINFRLPADTMLQYGGRFQELKGRLQ